MKRSLGHRTQKIGKAASPSLCLAVLQPCGPSVSSSRRRAGFTLLELLLTVALVALIMSVFYGILHSTLMAVEIVEEAVESSEIGPTLLNLMRQDLENAFLPKSDVEYFVGTDKKFGAGDMDRLDFVANTFAYGKETENQTEPRFTSLNEVGYQLKPNDKEPDFMVLYRREDLFIDEKPLQGGQLQELYDRVLSLNIEYYDGKDWLKDWNNVKNGKTLPQAVKLELKLSIPSRSGITSTGVREQTFTTLITLR